MPHCLLILLLLWINAFSIIGESQRPSTLKSQRKKTFAALVFSSSTNTAPSDKTPCQWLKRLKHQSKICWKRRGVAEILLEAKRLSIDKCEALYEFEQWNCSNRTVLFKKFYRETAFMYAFSTAALVYSMARGCSQSKVGGCSCGNPGKSGSNFHWSGCSDNVKFAKKFTNKFLQMRKKGDDSNALITYNSDVGINVVLDIFKKEKRCHCHGVSGSCTFQICYKQFRSFDAISNKLKDLYYDARKIQPLNNIQTFTRKKRTQQLLFLDDDQSFCPTTVGRRCNSTENCSTVCCGRTSYPKEIEVENHRCKCKYVSKIADVKCKICKEKKTIYLCT